MWVYTFEYYDGGSIRGHCIIIAMSEADAREALNANTQLFEEGLVKLVTVSPTFGAFTVVNTIPPF